jgi:hypothetical protein
MDTRFRLTVLALLGVLVAAVWTFPRWYPILNPNTVAVAFPDLELDVQDDFLLLPADLQRAYQRLRRGDADDDLEPQPALALALVRARLLGIDLVAPDDVQLAPIPNGAVTVRRGTFIKPNRDVTDLARGAQGNVIIYQLPTGERFLRLENFSTTRAPDLHLVFTRNPDPYDKQGVRVDYIDVGELLYTVGTQTYVVPSGVDFAVYPILALYSPALNYVMSSATLR